MSMLQEVMYYASFVNDIAKQNAEWRERILEEWKRSAFYPRKKKKAVRKRLRTEWLIANWDPLSL